MKKILGLFITLSLMISFVIPAGAAPADEFYDRFICTNQREAIGINGKLNAHTVDYDGWYTIRGDEIVITTLRNDVKIRCIEATLEWYGDYYPSLRIDHGTKRENREMPNGSLVHIDNIHSNSITLVSDKALQFSSMNVYYEISKESGSDTPSYDVSKESFTYNAMLEVTGIRSKLTTKRFDCDGWFVDRKEDIVIRTLDDNVKIRRIEAKIGWYGDYYYAVRVNHGTKRENREMPNRSTVYIDDINASSITLSSDKPVQFSEIIVYY